MRVSRQSALLDSRLANELVALLKNPGWQVELNQMLCIFGLKLKAEVTATGIQVEYLDQENELVYHLVPMINGHTATVTIHGRHAWHTIVLEWQETWDDLDESFIRSLTLVNDTLRKVEEKRCAKDNAELSRRLFALAQTAGLIKTPQA